MVHALGTRVAAPTTYAPDILEPIPRAIKGGSKVAYNDRYFGWDCWHLYELSWLDGEGVPQHFVGVLCINANSPVTIESKSLKLYLNSLNFHILGSIENAVGVICRDLEHIIQAPVMLDILPPSGISDITREPFGVLLEQCVSKGSMSNKDWLNSSGKNVDETLISHRLRSLCPVTAQPDWGTLVVDYSGPAINRGRLLELVDSFREHQDFHERCIEHCFSAISAEAKPDFLTVTGYYQRRGGIDITPTRSNSEKPRQLWRMGRQ
jgi:7-cyano-7-deazaguanine reductase